MIFCINFQPDSSLSIIGRYTDHVINMVLAISLKRSFWILEHVFDITQHMREIFEIFLAKTLFNSQKKQRFTTECERVGKENKHYIAFVYVI